MDFVYLLWHTHVSEELVGGEDSKLIGVYSSRAFAEEALCRSSLLEGFKDNLDGFEISEYKVDDDSWTSGFITV